jgi:hypothetical protein
LQRNFRSRQQTSHGSELDALTFRKYRSLFSILFDFSDERGDVIFISTRPAVVVCRIAKELAMSHTALARQVEGLTSSVTFQAILPTAGRILISMIFLLSGFSSFLHRQ